MRGAAAAMRCSAVRGVMSCPLLLTLRATSPAAGAGCQPEALLLLPPMEEACRSMGKQQGSSMGSRLIRVLPTKHGGF